MSYIHQKMKRKSLHNPSKGVTMSRKFEESLPLVILLDTNAVAYLTQYVEACTYLHGAELQRLEINNIEIPFLEYEEIQQKFSNKGELSFILENEIKRGYDLYKVIQQHAKNNEIQLWFSLFSEIELLNIFLKDLIHKELDKKKIPYRIRRKKFLKTQIFFDYQNKVAMYWEKIKKILESHDIEFNLVEKQPDSVVRIIEITKRVLKYITLDPPDAYLYSCAIFLNADIIYTYDKEFRTIMNNIRNSQEWIDIKNNLMREFDIKELPEGKTPHYEN